MCEANAYLITDGVENLSLSLVDHKVFFKEIHP